ncbi:MAG: hypothetical protein HOP19_28940, partial [Acidobacteria bacterium]|nr:hypothetical protein [Acidobacteriota bacterium]
MTNHSINTVAKVFPDARQQADGSITFECPACRDDAHPNKPVTLYSNGALSCVRFINGGRDANREHVATIRTMLGEAEAPARFLTETLFDGKLTLELAPAERGKVKLVARNCDSVLHRDALTLDKADDRAKFVKQLNYAEAEARTVHKALLAMADRYDNVAAAIDDDEEGDGQPRQVIFKALADGRLIEQIAGGVFAVYDPSTRAVTYSRKVKADEGEYRTLQDDFLMQGGLFLPDKLTEYESEASLDAEIEACINRYSDVPTRERKLAAKYVRLSYISDKLNEISYFRATGERGSGKSRFIGTVGMLCLRPVLVTSPSAASLYRTMDAYQPTLVIDEFNASAGSEDSEALMQILNCGFQRITTIPRCEKGADGQMTIKMFSAFGPKLLGGLKLTDSPAFESRCVGVQLQKTSRTDIPFRLTARMLNDFADLRAKLYLWRLRNWHTDFEQTLDDAERELKEYQIEPRFVQIAIPVYGLIGDANLKAEFARMLEGRTEDAAGEKQQTFDGRLVDIVHRLLFDVDGEEEKETVTWKKFDEDAKPVEGKPIVFARVEQIVEVLNEGRSEKKRYDAPWIGRELSKIGLKRKKIKSRSEELRDKPAIIFDREAFRRVFGNFSLPLPPEFTVPTVPTEANPSIDNEMRWG